MSMESQANIVFVAYGRVQDGMLLASWGHDSFPQIEETKETFAKILHAAKVFIV